MTDNANEANGSEIATDNNSSRELSPFGSTGHSDAEQWHQLKSLVLDGVTSQHSRRAYRIALDEFIAWWEHEGGPPFTKATVQAFRSKLERDGLAAATDSS